MLINKEKWSHAYKGYTSIYVEILYFFNPEQQLKDTEFAIKNKLIDLLTELRSFQYVTALVLEFKQKYSTFYNLVTLMILTLTSFDIDD